MSKYLTISCDSNKIHKIWRNLNGDPHHDSSPAEITINCKNNKVFFEAWYKNGKLHRLGGPAYFHLAARKKEWYQNGKLHRLDGPAIESNYYANSLLTEPQWYFEGERVYCNSQEEFERLIKLKALW